MTNVTSLLKLGAAVLITIAVIAIAVALFTMGTDITKNSEGDIKGLNQVMVTKKFDAYNNIDVSGSNVINAIKMYGETGSINVVVKTSGGTSTTYNATNKYNITSNTDANYINPVGTFSSVLTTNANGIVTTMTFTQK